MADLENNQAPETATISDSGSVQLADNVGKSEKVTTRDTRTVKIDIVRSSTDKATVKDTRTVLLDATKSQTDKTTVADTLSALVQTQGPTFWFALEIPAIETRLDIVASVLSVELDFPAIELSANILQGAVLSFPLEVPALEVSAAIKSGEKLSASLPIPAVELSLQIAPRNEINAALGITALRLSGTLMSGGVLSGAIEIPALTLGLTLGHQSRLAFVLEIPSIDPWLEIRVIPAFVPFRKGFVMNLSTFGVTEYSDYSFNSFCDYHLSGVYVGASEDGIFLLDGDDDNGVKINAVIQTGTEDLFAQVMKRLREGWAVKRGGPLSVQLILDEGRSPPVMRDMESVRGVSGEERVKFPRGLKNRFVSFAIRNLGGNDFSLESFRVMVDPITHRKR
jgi:hypothetical protein